MLLAQDIRTVVAAPSKLQRPAGSRVKTDAIDAAHLSMLLRLDAFTPVTLPDELTEAARDLFRAREDCRSDPMRARHRLSKFLLRHGIVYSGGQAWVGAHDAWLKRQRFDSPLDQAAFDVAPLPETRRLWRELAARTSSSLVVLECVIPDVAEHRRRVEGRHPDLPGQVVPSWDEVTRRDYVPWDEVRDGHRDPCWT